MYYFAKVILYLIGWKITGSLPPGVKKCVMIIAPHTSTWDFIIGKLAFWYLRLDVRVLIKKEFFVFPIGFILKSLGGLPVNREKGSNIVTQSIEYINKYDSIVIAITPEGTRKLNENWKKGFYYIAQKTNVPVAFGFLHYKVKRGGIGPTINISGDYDKDFKIIEDYYKNNTSARHPDRFNLSS